MLFPKPTFCATSNCTAQSVLLTLTLTLPPCLLPMSTVIESPAQSLLLISNPLDPDAPLRLTTGLLYCNLRVSSPCSGAHPGTWWKHIQEPSGSHIHLHPWQWFAATIAILLPEPATSAPSPGHEDFLFFPGVCERRRLCFDQIALALLTQNLMLGKS